jgi:hypothetical protein
MSTEDWKEAGACVDLEAAFAFVEKYDKAQDYAKRTVFVYHALALAAHKGMECGIRYDDSEGKEWPVVAIKLPTGEVAWHCKAYPHAYDGRKVPEDQGLCGIQEVKKIQNIKRISLPLFRCLIFLVLGSTQEARVYYFRRA